MDISSMLEVQVKEMKTEVKIKENGEHNDSKDNGVRLSYLNNFNAHVLT